MRAVRFHLGAIIGAVLALFLISAAPSSAKTLEECQKRCHRIANKCMEACEQNKNRSTDPDFVHKCKEMACKKMLNEHCVPDCLNPKRKKHSH